MKSTSLEPRRQRAIAPWRNSPGSAFRALRDFDEFFNDAFSTLSPFDVMDSQSSLLPLGEGRTAGVACDVRETDTSFQMCLDVPGMTKDDLDIEVSGNRLIVSGERQDEHEEGEEGGRSYFSERRFGQFERSFTLPENVDASQVKASCHNGVLELTIPKGQDSKRSKISISDGGKRQAIEASGKDSKSKH